MGQNENKKKTENTPLKTPYHPLPCFSRGGSLRAAQQQLELAVIPDTKRDDHQIHSNEELASEEDPSLGHSR